MHKLFRDIYTKKNENRNKAIVYAGIEVNENEQDIICLPPDHTVFPKIDIEEFNTDMEKCVIKCNWEANREQREAEEKKDIEEVSEEIKSQGETYDNEIDDKKGLDFRNLRATDFRNNKRVVLPDLDDDPEEIRRNNLRNELRQVVLKYKNENCDKLGNLIDNNLSETKLKDIRNLKCRMKKEGLVCGETDKTGKLTLDTLENISKKMDKHIKEDKTLNEKEIRKLENNLNRHMEFWVNILKPGENNKNLRRIKSNLITKDNQIPILRGTSKDNKEAVDKKAGPDVRPIM